MCAHPRGRRRRPRGRNRSNGGRALGRQLIHEAVVGLPLYKQVGLLMPLVSFRAARRGAYTGLLLPCCASLLSGFWSELGESRVGVSFPLLVPALEWARPSS